MSNYDWFEKSPPVPEVASDQYARWHRNLNLSNSNPLDRDELLARELKTLEKVVAKLAENFYEQYKSTSIPKITTGANTPKILILTPEQKIKELVSKIEDLETELADMTDDRDYWEREANERGDQLADAESQAELYKDKLEEMKSILD